MPTWGDILREINQTGAALAQTPGAGGVGPHDLVRRKYLNQVGAHTGRPTILYATAFTSRPQAAPGTLSIGPEDVQALMEAVHGLSGDNLDLILHSPGGSGTAAEAIVKYLRAKFTHIRVIVPHLAMSAATMLACASNEIVMGKHSFVGPVDPQLILQTALGPRSVPAHAIVEQFNRALTDANDPTKLRAWAPMLAQYGPDLLVTCQRGIELSEMLVSDWLRVYMFAGDPDAADKAIAAARWLGANSAFKDHSRHIGRDELRAYGLKVADLEADQTLQDNVLSVFHAATHTFNATPAAKIIENNVGKCFVKLSFDSVLQVQVQQPVAPPAVSAPAPPQGFLTRLRQAWRVLFPRI